MMPIPRLTMQEIGGMVRSQFNPETWPVEQFATAIHEAAHGLVAMSLGHRVTEVAIEQRAHTRYRWTGRCEHQGSRDRTEIGELVDQAVIIAAPFAAMRYTDGLTRSAEGDWWNMFPSDHADMVRNHQAVAPDLSFTKWQAQCRQAAESHLTTHARTLEALTIALLRRGRLDESYLQALAPQIACQWKDDDEPVPVANIPSASQFKALSSAQRNRIADALEQLLEAQRKRQPATTPRLQYGYETRDIVPKGRAA